MLKEWAIKDLSYKFSLPNMCKQFIQQNKIGVLKNIKRYIRDNDFFIC